MAEEFRHQFTALRTNMDKKIRAVVFDLDGTLIDTEKYYVGLGEQIAKEMGYDIPREVILSLRSLNRKFSRPMLKEMYGEDFDFDYFHRTRKERFAALLAERGIEKKPGADEILEELKAAGYCTAVATATDIERAEKYLKEIQLYDKFDKIISVSNVTNGKPMPDVYIEAYRLLGEEPEYCMAVEDSENGVKSAYGAGMRVVMVPDLAPPKEEVKPMLYGIADTLLEVKNFL